MILFNTLVCGVLKLKLNKHKEYCSKRPKPTRARLCKFVEHFNHYCGCYSAIGCFLVFVVFTSRIWYWIIIGSTYSSFTGWETANKSVPNRRGWKRTVWDWPTAAIQLKWSIGIKEEEIKKIVLLLSWQKALFEVCFSRKNRTIPELVRDSTTASRAWLHKFSSRVSVKVDRNFSPPDLWFREPRF